VFEKTLEKWYLVLELSLNFFKILSGHPDYVCDPVSKPINQWAEFKKIVNKSHS